jgi:drug/metabolite transporter (DMT)-like permease
MSRLISGLLLVFIAAFSYVYFFSRWPVTRDVPWTAFVLFVVALALMISGLRRTPRKVIASIVMVIGIAFMAFFTFGTLVGTRMLPASHGSPAIGAKAPDFTLPDTNHRNVTLSQLVAAPGANGVLLIFYRGYW